MLLVDPKNDFISSSRACQLLGGVSLNEVERAAEKAGVEVRMRLNAVSYYAADQIPLIRSALAHKRGSSK